jgi:hypothetical protein
LVEQLPRTRTPTAFCVDLDAVEAARLLLELQWDVVVSITRFRDQGLSGRYNGWRAGAHRISLSGVDETAASVSRALWHELGHAKHAEQVGSAAAYRALVRSELRQAGIDPHRGPHWWQSRAYRRMPHERYAEAVAKKFHAQVALCRPT